MKKANLKIYKRPLRSQKGSIFIFIFLGVLVFTLFMSALAIDIDHFIAVQTQLQQAADAAALAGAHDLQWNNTSASDTASTYAMSDASSVLQANYVDGSQLTSSNFTNGTPSVISYGPAGDTYNAIKVSLSKPTYLMFAPLVAGAMGVSASGGTVNVTASSTAASLPVKTGGILPLILSTNPGPVPGNPTPPAPPLTPNTLITIYFPKLNGSSPVNNYGGLTPPGGAPGPAYPASYASVNSPNPPDFETAFQNALAVSNGTGGTANVSMPGTVYAPTNGDYNSSNSSPASNASASAIWANGGTFLIPITSQNLGDNGSPYSVQGFAVAKIVPGSATFSGSYYDHGTGPYGYMNLQIINTYYNPVSVVNYSSSPGSLIPMTSESVLVQ